MTDQQLIDKLADRIEAETDHDVTREEHGVVIDGEFEMFGDEDVRHVIDSFMRTTRRVSGWSVGVNTPPGSVTGPMVVDKIEVVPNA